MKNNTTSFINTEETKAEILVEPLSENEQLRKAVQSKKTRLGLFNEIVYHREAGKALRERMGQIAIALLEAQKEDIIHRLMLDGDIRKKKAYGIYQTQVSELNKEIIKESERITDELNGMIQEGISTIYHRRGSWTSNIKNMYKQGLLDDDSRQKELERMNRWIDRSLDELDDKAILFAKSQAETLAQTLKLLDQRKIEDSI
ncbi:hypothetical protein ACM66Z_07140 [Sulfurovum sp. ST-21]|uniref:Uncharacterized protein n=1 Tax=Sulfurovum indicum TaxID=2779528 RepID=A0A7M1S1B4_9BACT|nr:hypothetical protein [Sulfurovum indicum]QOR61227.1 hypothetical protein IMZ28_07135 [Sulfurovum indicum]